MGVENIVPGGGGLDTWVNKRAGPRWLTLDMLSLGGWQFEGLTARKSRWAREKRLKWGQDMTRG